MVNTMKEQLTKLLLDTKVLLDTYKVEFWLDHGTLLGAVREDDFIPWERDIDLGIWHHTVSEDTKQRIAEDLRNLGYKVLLMPTYMDAERNEVWLDVAFYQNSHGMATNSGPIPINAVGRYLGYARAIMLAPNHFDVVGLKHYPLILLNTACGLIPMRLRGAIVKVVELLYKKVGYKTWVIPARYFDEFSTVEFCGKRFNVPINPEEYLTFRYGSDWKIPKRNWETIDGGGVE